MNINEIFTKCQSLIDLKGHDYTKDPNTNRHQNFQRSADISSWFDNSTDKVYTTLIATKLARLATLLNGKSPKNESIEDSFIDLVNYCALWADYRTEIKLEKTVNNICWFCVFDMGDENGVYSKGYRDRVAHVHCWELTSVEKRSDFNFK